jgi:hypothetical protein
MQRTDVLEFARQLGLSAPDRSSTANWINYQCPFAPWKHASKRDRTASFGIRVDDRAHSHYWCFACKSKGEFHTLAWELGQLRGRDYREIASNIQRVELVGPIWIPRKWDDVIEENLNENATLSEIAYPDPATEFQYYSAAGHPYLASRGIGLSASVRLGLRYDPFQRRILFPVYDQWGRFAGFSGRRVDAPFRHDTDGTPFERNGEPYLKARDYLGLRKSDFFLGEHFIGARLRDGVSRVCGRAVRKGPYRNRIILVEGLFDYAYLVELGYRNCLAILGSNLTPVKVQKLIDWRQAVVLFMDNDKAGIDCVQNCKDLLLGKVPLLNVSYPDGFDGADPGSLPPSVIHAMYNDASLVLVA